MCKKNLIHYKFPDEIDSQKCLTVSKQLVIIVALLLWYFSVAKYISIYTCGIDVFKKGEYICSSLL
jgi:hypothetical protein